MTYLSDYYTEIISKAQANKFNLLEAPMGSGKSHFIKEYAKRNKDKNCVLVFFKNGIDDFSGSENVQVMYYKDLFIKLINQSLDISNLVIFADEYDYLVSVMKKILFDAKKSLEQLPVSALTEGDWNNIELKTKQFLNYLRENCCTLFLVSATRIEDSDFYAYGNPNEVSLISNDMLASLNKIRINSVTEVLRGRRQTLLNSAKQYLSSVEDGYDLVIVYSDTIDTVLINTLARATSKPKKAMLPSAKVGGDLCQWLGAKDIVWSSLTPRLNSETFTDALNNTVFLNQSSNRGTSIVDFKGKVLVLHTGKVNPNKVQMAGRWRDNEAVVDVVYFNKDNDSVHQELETHYSMYCDTFTRYLNEGSPKAIKQKKKDLVLKHYNPNLSYRENADMLLQQHGLKVSYVSIRKYVS